MFFPMYPGHIKLTNCPKLVSLSQKACALVREHYHRIFCDYVYLLYKDVRTSETFPLGGPIYIPLYSSHPYTIFGRQ